jgi:hypothetical protein
MNSLTWKKTEKALKTKTQGHIFLCRNVIDKKTTKGNTYQFTHTKYEPCNINDLLKQDNNLFERLQEDTPRFFYVDIDIKQCNPLFGKYTIPQIKRACDVVVNCICDKYFDGLQVQADNVYACYVEDQTQKQSLHIVYKDIPLKDHIDCKHFYNLITYELMNAVDADIEEAKCILSYGDGGKFNVIIDQAVYCERQCMRCLYQTKALDKGARQLIPFSDKSNNPTDYILGIYEKPSEGNINTLDVSHAIFMQDAENMDTTKTYTKQRKRDHRRANVLREYPKDQIQPNTSMKHDEVLWYLSCIPNTAQNPQSFTLWTTLGRILYTQGSLSATPNKYLEAWIEWSNKANPTYPDEETVCRARWRTYTHLYPNALRILRQIAVSYAGYNTVSQFDKDYRTESFFNPNLSTLDPITYNSRYCLPIDFVDTDIYVLQSAMGTGKTKIITDYMTQHKPRRICYIGSRVAFCKEKLADFNKAVKEYGGEFIYYKSETFKNHHKPININMSGIEYESIHAFKDVSKRTGFDLLILDEIEALGITATSATNGDNLGDNWETFKRLVAYSKVVYVADAFISKRTVDMLHDIRQPLPTATGVVLNNPPQPKRIKLYVNEYIPDTVKADIIAHRTKPKQGNDPKEVMKYHILKDLQEGKNIVVVSSSKKFLKDLKPHIVAKLNQMDSTDPESLLKFYDGDTGDDIFDNDLSNVADEWAKCRVLAYTTKITVGVNFDKMHFDTKYIYASSCGALPRDIIQAYFRVRKLKENNIYVALDTSRKPNQKITYDNLDMLYEHFDAEFGKQATSLKRVELHNEYERKICEYDYAYIFMDFLKRCGCDVVDKSKIQVSRETIANCLDKLDFTNAPEKQWNYIRYILYNIGTEAEQDYQDLYIGLVERYKPFSTKTAVSLWKSTTYMSKGLNIGTLLLWVKDAGHAIKAIEQDIDIGELVDKAEVDRLIEENAPKSCFQTLKQLQNNKALLEDLQLKVANQVAGETEKILIDTYFMYKDCVAYSQMFNEHISNMTNEEIDVYITSLKVDFTDEVKDISKNLRLERERHYAYDVCCKAQGITPIEYKYRVIKYNAIEAVKKILGIKWSFDVCEFDEAPLLKVYDYYNGLDEQTKNALRLAFDLKLRVSKGKKEDTEENKKRLEGKYMLNMFLKSWIGNEVESKKKNVRQGKKQVWVYTYKLVEPEKQCDLIKYVKDKARAWGERVNNKSIQSTTCMIDDNEL